ncbi:unnamed protein product, partial [Prorocentrum cordatum]
RFGTAGGGKGKGAPAPVPWSEQRKQMQKQMGNLTAELKRVEAAEGPAAPETADEKPKDSADSDKTNATPQKLERCKGQRTKFEQGLAAPSEELEAMQNDIRGKQTAIEAKAKENE